MIVILKYIVYELSLILTSNTNQQNYDHNN